MGWTTPMTFTAGAVLTAAQLNAQLRDNMNETTPAKATTAGSLFVATGLNAIAERQNAIAGVIATETTASTSYTNLTTPGPSVTLTTGTKALVWWKALTSNNTAGAESMSSPAVSGASSVAAADGTSTIGTSNGAGDRYALTGVNLFTGLTAGSNTFTLQYRVGAGTGSFAYRQIVVQAL